jgi:MFS superfamily sulfate permease-like transporter
MNKDQLNPFKNFKYDIPASVVVFLVAIPLCLGIALASEAPPLSGIIAGIIGGIVVSSASSSPLGVSGPAAGLAVIVATAIGDLGSFEALLVAVILAGFLQVIMGFLKFGTIAYYFPSSVIHGMLAGIGILIFLKQIPHAFGDDRDPEGDESFFQFDGENTFSEIFVSITDLITPGVLIVTAVSLAILLLWQLNFIKKYKITALLSGPLVAVIAGILLNNFFLGYPNLTISADHLVHLPEPKSASDFLGNFTLPDFTILNNPQVYLTAGVIAIVASMETLLCVEAGDKLDVYKRITPPNRELKAQGLGNIVSGFIGGLPITQVVVRSSANQQAGGRTKASAIFHGVFILISIIFIPNILNMIPFGTLAAILMVVGYKLANPSLFKKMYKEGNRQFIPFIVTIIGIVLTDLLIGIALGLVVAIVIILSNNLRIPFKITSRGERENKVTIITLSEDVTFLNKASVMTVLNQIPDDSILEIDASQSQFIHHDIIEIIEDFKINAEQRGIKLTVIELTKDKQIPKLSELERGKIKG